MSRRKKPAIDVPATREEAAQLLADYVARERDILALGLLAERKIDAIKSARDLDLTRLQAEQASRFASLKAWWEAGGREVAGSLRSTELAGAKIGIRLTPPKVKFAKGIKADAIVGWLRGVRWARAKEFFRTKYELDKPAVIKGVQADEKVRDTFKAQGVTVGQDDEFFIDAGLDENAVRAAIAAEVGA
ncbi:host-nuclease inhibitor Gam family protein [Sphingomonas sp.]|uniref:host-nuclease inhibitor Gam family protein n=1 Tax=Sphingomonas sp. TaxID=28214 RepID=UPI00307F6EED